MREDTFRHGRERLERVRARSASGSGRGGAVQPPNLRYLTGFHSNAYSRPLALVVPAAGEPTLLVPRLEETQARDMTRSPTSGATSSGTRDRRRVGGSTREWRTLLTGVLTSAG